LDGTDDDDVVRTITEQLQLELFPTQNGLLYQYLMCRRGLQPTAKRRFEFFFFMYESASGTTQCVRRPDNQRESDLLGGFFPFKERVGDFGCGHADTDFDHQLAELFPVLGFLDGCDVDTDDLYIIFFPKPALGSLDAQVECCLPTHGRKYSVYLSLLQDLFDTFAGKRQQINMVSNDVIGHDGGRIGVDDGYFNS